MPKFIKEIVPPGRYKVNTLAGKRRTADITKSRIRHWVNQFSLMTKAGLKVPAPFTHDPNALPAEAAKDAANPANNAGYWTRLFQKDGKLYGEIDVPDQATADKIGATVKEVSPMFRDRWTDGKGKEWKDPILHIALVNHPVAHGTSDFIPSEKFDAAQNAKLPAGAEQCVVCSISGLMSTDEEDLSPARDTAGGKEGETDLEGDDRIPEALEALEMFGIHLPEDTTAENFLDNLITAIRAIKSYEKSEHANNGDQDHPLSQLKEQPTPIAMSTDNKALNALIVSTKRDITSRIDRLLKAKVITPAFKKAKIDPLLNTFTMSIDDLDDKGDRKPGRLDDILDALEANAQPGSAASFFNENKDRDVSFMGAREEKAPDEVQGEWDPNDTDAVDAVVASQMKAAGMSRQAPRIQSEE